MTLSPEVQASIIRVAGEWALQMAKASGAGDWDTVGKDLGKAFEWSYKTISDIVESFSS